jgi:hypothetical protein
MKSQSAIRPNKAPEPTTMTVTPRAPSSTSRAGHGRGSSVTLGKKMIGVFLGLLVLLAVIPLGAWFLVKCVRAAYVPAVKDDFKKRPIFHIVWALASLVALNGVLTWLPAFTNR